MVHPAKAGCRLRLAHGGCSGGLHPPLRRALPAGLPGREEQAACGRGEGTTRSPAHGRPARQDYEYERNGTANLFIVCEPLAGWRHISVTERRTKLDWAHCIKELVDLHYPKAERIVLVMDNLNTHTPAALYEAFAPTEARRLLERLEIHYTPKHGSWLNMAEIELSVLSRQCLDQRIPDQETLGEEVGAWEAERNAYESSIDWRFTTEDARIKLKHLYPEIVEPSYGPNLS